MQKVVKEAENRVKQAMPKKVSLLPSSLQTSAPGTIRLESFEPRKRKAAATTALEKAFNVGACEKLHSHIARIFSSAGFLFHLARNPY